MYIEYNLSFYVSRARTDKNLQQTVQSSKRFIGNGYKTTDQNNDTLGLYNRFLSTLLIAWAVCNSFVLAGKTKFPFFFGI